MNILGISGSTRKDSRNTLFIKSLSQFLPESGKLTLANMEDFPPIIGPDSAELPSVKKIIKQIKDSEILIFSTPEFNYSYSQIIGSLINLSPKEIWKDKPSLIAGVALDEVGTSSARSKLHDRLTELGAKVYEHDIDIPKAEEIIDTSGNIKDSSVKSKVSQTIKKFLEFARQSS